MVVSGKVKGWRLSTKLIITYSFVALLAVAAAVGVALPLLQRYQDDQVKEQRQRTVVEDGQRLNVLYSLFQSAKSSPFKDFLAVNPEAAVKNRTWPAAPTIELVRQRFMEFTQGNGRLLVITEREQEVMVDTEPDPKASLLGQVVALARTSPVGAAAANGRLDATLTAANGRVYTLVWRPSARDTAPNLFGLTNQGLPQPYVLALVVPDIPAHEVWQDLSLILAGAGLVALLVASLAGFLLARSLTRPLVRLTAASQAVARGDYAQRVEPEGGYEMTRLAETFNQMTYNVDKSQRMQRQLIANVSHELKTPLTSIQGFSQAMLDGVLRRPEDYTRPAEIISHETARMIRLVNSLLELSKLESGQAALHLGEIDLAQVLQTCADSFAPQATTNQVYLQTDFKTPLRLKGDPDRLNQVFNNLIHNALKNTPAGGTVRLTAYRAGPNIIASVTDTGGGIPAADLPNIFDRFYQSDKSRRRDLVDEGTGLGLAISREIIQAHGGKINAASEVNKGSQFTVILPALSKAAIQDRPTEPLKKPGSTTKNIELVNNKPSI
jgi:signal transduction histidine kinase